MLKIDLHSHTIMSGHAFNTVYEMAKAASEKGIEAIATTDHGPGMPGGPDVLYFGVLYRLPKEIYGVRVLGGCEANVMDDEGTIDLSDELQAKLDWVIIGLHSRTFPKNPDIQKNTNALIKAVEKNRVQMVSHPVHILYPVDIEQLFFVCLKNKVLMELNLHYLEKNLANEEYMAQSQKLVDLAIANNCKLVLNSDAHVATELGDDSVLKKLPFTVPANIILGAREGYKEVEKFLAENKKYNDNK